MRRRVRAGRLRHRVVFQQLEITPDDAGGQSSTWVDQLDRRCDQEHQGGRVFQALQKQYSQMSHVFTLRNAEINPQWRLVFEGQPHRILSVSTEDDRRIQIITEAEQETRNYGH